MPRPPACPARSRLTRAVLACALLTVLLAGCAVTPPKPPDCDGPWTPINPTRPQAR